MNIFGEAENSNGKITIKLKTCDSYFLAEEDQLLLQTTLVGMKFHLDSTLLDKLLDLIL